MVKCGDSSNLRRFREKQYPDFPDRDTMGIGNRGRNVLPRVVGEHDEQNARAEWVSMSRSEKWMQSR